MPVNLKVTWGGGASSARLMGLGDRTTLGELKALISNRSGLDPSCIQLKAGFPPRDVSGRDENRVVEVGITSGSALTVIERKQPPSASMTQAQPPSTPLAAAAPRPAAAATPPAAPALPRARPGARAAPGADTAPSLPRQEPPIPARPRPEPSGVSPEILQTFVDMGFPPEYATRALEAAGGDVNTALEICMGGDELLAGDARAPAPAAPLPRTMVRRVIDADNSCLFNAVGYAMRRKRKVATELRAIITEAVRSSPLEYTEAILGKAPGEYCRWISDSKSWGGEIELSILSKKLSVLITVVDIQTNNTYSYGEGQGFDRRIFVIYDGIHYDALAEAAGESAPEADDVTIFNPAARDKEAMVKALAADLKAKNQFTDMGNCDLKCLVCSRLLEGQKGALEHARATGHQNFGQI